MPARARARAAFGGSGGRLAGARPGSGSGPSSLPGLVLFEPGLTGMGYRGSYPLRHPDPNRPAQRLSANCREELGGCYLK